MRLVNPEHLRPLHKHLIVRKYSKPEKVRGLWLNPAWRVDNSRSLWEVVHAPPECSEVFGFVPEEDDILVTGINRGVYIGDHENDPGVELYMLASEEVAQVVPWTRPEEATIPIVGARLLVKPEEQEAEVASGILAPEPSLGPPNIGRIKACGSMREASLRPGVRIVFAPHAGVTVELAGEKLVLMKEEEVEMVIDDDKEMET